MTIKDTLSKMDSLKRELDSLKPLKKEDDDRLWKKFKLDFNWNSNHLEGNTLSYKETELLLIFDKTSEGHDLREFEEMKAHDVALKMIVELARDKERDLSETFIRQLNEIILVRPFLNKALTPDGKRTMREITPGEYKKQPNSVLLKSGEMFHYPSPEETPALMGDLMKFYKENSVSTEVHPAWLAAMMHYKFVRIHPFDDGNGRVTRLIMNFILLKHGYPPAIIKSSTKDKNDYLFALNKADVNDEEYFQNYIYEQVIRSLELSIKAAKGEVIEEPEDYRKKISLLKSELSPNEEEDAKVIFTKQSFLEIYDTWLSELIKGFIVEVKEYNELFVKPTHYISIDSGVTKHGHGITHISETFTNENEEEIANKIKEKLKKENVISNDTNVVMQASYGLFKRKVLKHLFGASFSIEVFFNYVKYDIFITDNFGDVDRCPDITEQLKIIVAQDENIDKVYFDKNGLGHLEGELNNKEGKYYINDEEIRFICKREDILNDKIRSNGKIRYKEQRLLHKPLTHEEVKELCKRLSTNIYEHIDYYTKKYGIR